MNSKTRSRLKALSSKTKIKHVVDFTDLATTGNTTQHHALLVAADNPTIANVASVATGSQVFNMILQMNVASIVSGTLQPIRADWYLMYNPKGTITSFADPSSVGTSPQKDLVFKQGMEMTSAQFPVLIKGVVKIPKKWTKFQSGDEIDLVYRFTDNTANASNFCTKAIYREYR